MRAFYADHFVLPLPEGHRFPMAKYGLLRAALSQALPGLTLCEALAATDLELATVHDPVYIQAVAQGGLASAAQREIGFPWSPAMAERARRSVGGTVQACRAALAGEGIAANLAGGTHHAYAEKGGGFCVFNDVAVAARVMQAEHGHQAQGQPLRVAIIDLDVHQGNGTAHIFQGVSDVFTLSMHGDKNFPFRKEASHLDVGLPDGTADAPYLTALDAALAELDRRFAPGLVIYLAGADVFEGDRLGRLKLTAEGVAERDRRVFDWCWARRLPVALVMGGGYGHDIHATVAVQVNTYREAYRHALRWQNQAA
ncbi:histone deacetylase family protein [Hydrogenophaga soli]